MTNSPVLITFDIFGTVLDWRSGLERACAVAGRPLGPGDFDRIVDVQAELEHREFLTYSEITRRSLEQAIGLPGDEAGRIAANVGRWPLYDDSREALRALMPISRCGAMTNSDRSHGEQVQVQLGFHLHDWLCAEEAGVYKPDPEFWKIMARRAGVEMGPRWWHVSAYADYDLATAHSLGLTTVFVERPHARPGPATHAVGKLKALAGLLG
jgi:putative hydrolase of the HAD superfamily